MDKESHSSVQKFKSAFCLNILMEPIATLYDNLILQHRNSLTKLKKKILKVTSNKKQPTTEKVSGHRQLEEERNVL